MGSKTIGERSFRSSFLFMYVFFECRFGSRLFQGFALQKLVININFVIVILFDHRKTLWSSRDSVMVLKIQNVNYFCIFVTIFARLFRILKASELFISQSLPRCCRKISTIPVHHEQGLQVLTHSVVNSRVH